MLGSQGREGYLMALNEFEQEADCSTAWDDGIPTQSVA